jgi:8-oxo-dGTP pyrophosphatase MutT (NUDIX family)
MIPQGAAVILVQSFKQDGKMVDFVWLAQRLKPGHYHRMWEVPGGTVKPGEDPKAAAIRECEEECGVQLADTQVEFVSCDVSQHPDGVRFATHWFKAWLLPGQDLERTEPEAHNDWYAFRPGNILCMHIRSNMPAALKRVFPYLTWKSQQL